MPEIRTVIVGTAWKGQAALDALAALEKGDALELRCEPENQVDVGAVALYRNGIHIGYVPRHTNPQIGHAIAYAGPVTAQVTAEAVMAGGEVARGGLPKILVSWGSPEEIKEKMP